MRPHEQPRALGVRQRVGTMIVKMNKNRNEGLKRILTERKRLRALPFAIRCKDCGEALEVAEERVGDRRLDGWFAC